MSLQNFFLPSAVIYQRTGLASLVPCRWIVAALCCKWQCMLAWNTRIYLQIYAKLQTKFSHRPMCWALRDDQILRQGAQALLGILNVIKLKQKVCKKYFIYIQCNNISCKQSIFSSTASTLLKMILQHQEVECEYTIEWKNYQLV